MEFLTESNIALANRLLRLSPPAVDALYESAAIVRGHAGLLELLRQCNVEAVQHTDAVAFSVATAGYPKFVEDHATFLRSEMGEHEGMFAVIIVLGLLDWTTEYYRKKEIMEDVLIDTLNDLSIWMKHYYDDNGVWGLSNLSWLLNHLGGRLFRLGRLQFIHKAFHQAVIVLRNINSRQVIMLSELGVKYRRDGRVDGTNGQYDSVQGWTACYHQVDDSFVGNPIYSSSGFASKGIVMLPAADWRIMLRRNDPVLDIHIPEGTPMLPEQCRESFELAVRFYRERFPEKPFHALMCTSWLLDPQLADLVPASSNITSFQRMLHLFPVLSGDSETYRRVFGTDILDLATARKDTRLRRAIVEYIEAGHRLHGGGGLLLSDDFNV